MGCNCICLLDVATSYGRASRRDAPQRKGGPQRACGGTPCYLRRLLRPSAALLLCAWSLLPHLKKQMTGMRARARAASVSRGLSNKQALMEKIYSYLFPSSATRASRLRLQGVNNGRSCQGAARHNRITLPNARSTQPDTSPLTDISTSIPGR